MKKNFLFKAFGLLTLALLVLNSCKKDEPTAANPIATPNNYTPPAVTFSTTVQGFVVDENGEAVYAAEVKTGNKTTTTDKNGYFKIDAAPFTGDFCYIKAVKKGFFTGSSTIHGKAGSKYAAELVIVSQSNVVSFSAAQGKNISLQGGAEVKLPAGGFVTADGKSYTGNVNVAVMHIDPSAKNFSSLIPGGDLRAFDNNGQNVQLYSYGMLNVEMRDDAGNLLQLASGAKSTLTVPVPTTMVATAPATIPLWYFDEDKGIWIEEGSATLQGSKYVGTVSHFTPWNMDVPGPTSTIKGRIVDSEGNTPEFAAIQMGQLVVWADDKGFFTGGVPSGIDIDIDVYDQMNGEVISGNTLVVDALSPNIVKDVGDIILEEVATIKATMKDCNGSPVGGYAFVKSSGATRRVLFVDGDCKFNVKTAGDIAEMTCFTFDYNHKSVKSFIMPLLHQTLDLGVISICDKNVESSVSFTYQIGNQTPVNVSYDIPPKGYYLGGGGYTNIIFSDASQYRHPTYEVFFSFLGGEDKPATITLGTQSSFNFRWEISSEPDVTESVLRGTNVELVLTKVGGVGEEVTATFSGQGVLYYKNGASQNATITNGKFTTVRIQ